MKEVQRYPIKVVAQRTGLTVHVIRSWEKRYRLVTPTRTTTNRRLYSEADIERLQLLRQATAAGHNISQVADLAVEQLRQLAGVRTTLPDGAAGAATAPEDLSPDFFMAACLRAVRTLAADALEQSLAHASVALSRPALVEQLITPLIQKVGEQWCEGTLRVVHEHMATTVIRTFLGNLKGTFAMPASAPGLIATTPTGQLHELGALIAAATAAAEGWRVTYLGPNLPAEEIALAVQQNHARVVALSLIYPPDDHRLCQELRSLRRHLPAGVDLIVGGRAAGAYIKALDEIGALVLADMPSFRQKLERLRVSALPVTPETLADSAASD